VKIGIIGGSGLSESELKNKTITIKTPYGDPSSPYEIQELETTTVYFLKRHGQKHAIAPHKVNYRANIYGFKQIGIERLFGIFATGSLEENISPGTIVIPDQLIDFTQGIRNNTFYDTDRVVHIDFTEPFCSEMRLCLLETAKKIGVNVIPNGTYICVNGPRLETAAEIKFFKNIGADIIGMTLMPEASLARETQICYTAVSVIANYAAGISKNPLTVKEVIDTMHNSLQIVWLLIKESIKNLPGERNCYCKDALKNSSF